MSSSDSDAVGYCTRPIFPPLAFRIPVSKEKGQHSKQAEPRRKSRVFLTAAVAKCRFYSMGNAKELSYFAILLPRDRARSLQQYLMNGRRERLDFSFLGRIRSKAIAKKKPFSLSKN